MAGSSYLSPAFWTRRSPMSHTVSASGSQKIQHPMQFARCFFEDSHPSHAICGSRLRKTQPSHEIRKGICSGIAALPHNLHDAIARDAPLSCHLKLLILPSYTPLARQVICCRLDVCPSHIIWKSYFSICAPLSRHVWFKTSKNATLTRNSKSDLFRICSPPAQFARRNRQRRTPLMQFEGRDFAHVHPSCSVCNL